MDSKKNSIDFENQNFKLSPNVLEEAVASQVVPKSTERAPNFQNTSLITNPYLNQQRDPSGGGGQRVNFPSWKGIMAKNAQNNSLNRKNRNLAVLSRNLRNLSYLKSPLPAPGTSNKDREFNVNKFDELVYSNAKNCNSYSWARKEEGRRDSLVHIESQTIETEGKPKHPYSDYEEDLYGSLSISTIVNRNEGKALAKLVANNSPYNEGTRQDTNVTNQEIPPLQLSFQEYNKSISSPYENNHR